MMLREKNEPSTERQNRLTTKVQHGLPHPLWNRSALTKAILQEQLLPATVSGSQYWEADAAPLQPVFS